MLQIVSLILSILASAGFITLVTLKSVRKKAAEEAESISIDNDSKRVEGYIVIIDDLNTRIAAALESLRKLEHELGETKRKNITLESENRKLRNENDKLKREIERLKDMKNNVKKIS